VGTWKWGCLAGRCASLCLQAAHGGRAAGGSGQWRKRIRGVRMLATMRYTNWRPLPLPLPLRPTVLVLNVTKSLTSADHECWRAEIAIIWVTAGMPSGSDTANFCRVYHWKKFRKKDWYLAKIWTRVCRQLVKAHTNITNAWSAWSKGRQTPGARSYIYHVNQVNSHNGSDMMTGAFYRPLNRRSSPLDSWIRGRGKSKPQDGGGAYSLKYQIRFLSCYELQKKFFSFHKVSTLLLTKKSRSFPGLSGTTVKNFPIPFRSPQMFKHNILAP